MKALYYKKRNIARKDQNIQDFPKSKHLNAKYQRKVAETIYKFTKQFRKSLPTTLEQYFCPKSLKSSRKSERISIKYRELR